MSTHSIGFYEEISKIIFQLSSNIHLISSSDNFTRAYQGHMNLVVRKMVFGVFDLVPHKPGCTATEDG